MKLIILGWIMNSMTAYGQKLESDTIKLSRKEFNGVVGDLVTCEKKLELKDSLVFEYKYKVSKLNNEASDLNDEIKFLKNKNEKVRKSRSIIAYICMAFGFIVGVAI